MPAVARRPGPAPPLKGGRSRPASAPAPAEPPRKRTGASVLYWCRLERSFGEERATKHWAGLSPAEQTAALAAADEEGRDLESLHAAVADRLAAASA